MKKFVLGLLFSIFFKEMVKGQSLPEKCLGIDPKIKTAQPVQFQGTLVGIEMLPQGAPFIKELERKKLVPLFGHYYSVQVKLKACRASEWFICSDDHFKMLEEMLEKQLDVKLSGTYFANTIATNQLPVIIKQISRKN